MLSQIQTIEQLSSAIGLMRLGTASLQFAFALTFLMALLSGLAMWRKDERWAHAVRRGQYAIFLTTAFCCALLYVGIFDGYYFVGYIRAVTENNESFGFKMSALWASQQGSLLFWCFILTGFSAVFAFSQRHNRTDRRMPAILLVLSVVQFFFFFIMVSPFDLEAAQRSSPFAMSYDWLILSSRDEATGVVLHQGTLTIKDAVERLTGNQPSSMVQILMAAFSNGLGDITLAEFHSRIIASAAELPPQVRTVMLDEIADGRGMNPALHNYWIAIHPPMLYLGFVGFTIPFAWAVGSLISGEVHEGWLRPIRLWTMGAWIFLTVGIALGGLWAYEILGWGGYWAWDPVENASFIPWLTGTAFIHSVIVTERRGILRVWSFALIIITYCMTVIGTFLVRSGIINSVHAFGATGNVDMWFYGFIAVVFVGSLLALVWRLPLLKSERRLESLLSREGAFLFNNLVFLAIALVTLIITFWPWITEKLFGKSGIQEFGQDAFVLINIPLFLLVLVLMGVGPALAWRRHGLAAAARALTFPALAGLVVFIINAVWLGLGGLLVSTDQPDTMAAAAATVRLMAQLTLWPICVFTGACIAIEFFTGARARARSTHEPFATALYRMTVAGRRRYGGYIVHAGILLIALGIYYSSIYEGEGTVIAAPGGFGVIENKLTGERHVAYYAAETRTDSWDRMQAAFGGDAERARRFEQTLRFVRANPDKDVPQMMAEIEREARAAGGGELPPQFAQGAAQMAAALSWAVSQRDNTRVHEDFVADVYVFPFKQNQAPDTAAFRRAHDEYLAAMIANTDQAAIAGALGAVHAEGIKLGVWLPETLLQIRDNVAGLDDAGFQAYFGASAENAAAMADLRHTAMQELADVHDGIAAGTVTARNTRVVQLAHRIAAPDAWSQLVALRPLSLAGLIQARKSAAEDVIQRIDDEIAEISLSSIMLKPQMRIFYDRLSGAPRMDEPLKDPYYSRSLTRDLYFILQDAKPDGTATLRFFIKPHMTLGLLGLLVLIGGTVLAFLPSFRKRRAA